MKIMMKNEKKFPIPCNPTYLVSSDRANYFILRVLCDKIDLTVFSKNFVL
jgi:hypothetical protein